MPLNVRLHPVASMLGHDSAVGRPAAESENTSRHAQALLQEPICAPKGQSQNRKRAAVQEACIALGQEQARLQHEPVQQPPASKLANSSFNLSLCRTGSPELTHPTVTQSTDPLLRASALFEKYIDSIKDRRPAADLEALHRRYVLLQHMPYATSSQQPAFNSSLLKQRSCHIDLTADSSDDTAAAAARSTDVNMSWPDLYQPQTVDQMCGNDQAREQLASWLCTWQQSTAAEQHPTSSALMQDDCSDDDWFQGEDASLSHSDDGQDAKQTTSAVLVSGPVGSGKSALVYAAAKAAGLQVIEVNSGSKCNGSNLAALIGEAMHSCNLQRSSTRNASGIADKGQVSREGTHGRQQSLIVFEEADSMIAQDPSIARALLKLASSSRRPIVLTCNNPTQLASLDAVQHFRLQRPSAEALLDQLVLVAAHQGIPTTVQRLADISHSCNYDIRHTLLMSQVWAAAPHYPQTVPQEAATHAADLHSAAMQMATLASASLAEEGDMTSTEQHAALQCDSAQQTASLNVMGDDVNPPTDRAQTTALSSSVFCQHCGGCAEYRQASSGALQTVQATKTACCCDPLTMSQPQKHQAHATSREGQDALHQLPEASRNPAEGIRQSCLDSKHWQSLYNSLSAFDAMLGMSDAEQATCVAQHSGQSSVASAPLQVPSQELSDPAQACEQLHDSSSMRQSSNVELLVMVREQSILDGYSGMADQHSCSDRLAWLAMMARLGQTAKPTAVAKRRRLRQMQHPLCSMCTISTEQVQQLALLWPSG